MRIAVIIAASVLLAACSTGGGGENQPTSQPRLSVPSSATHTTTAKPPTTTTKPIPTAAPAAATPMPEVIKWVEAGAPAEAGGFHKATRDGETTDLGEDVSFVAASGITRCATDKLVEGQLSCLVKSDGLPPKPSDVEGQWIAGWVDFAGETLDIGSLHGDPGRFTYGDGAKLPAGQSLAFGDYRCRGDASALLCVNYAHQSAMRISGSGVEPLGCLKSTPPPVGVGAQFSCPPD